MRKRGKEKRTIIFFILLLMFFGGLIILVGVVKRPPIVIMPPESEEMIAKRGSPDNAFYPLIDGCNLLLQKQQQHKGEVSVRRDGNRNVRAISNRRGPQRGRRGPRRGRISRGAKRSGQKVSKSAPKEKKYKPEPGSAGHILGLPYEDNAPEIAEYLKEQEALFVAVRQALDKEYFLFPEIKDITVWEGNYFSSNGFGHARSYNKSYLTVLNELLVAKALHEHASGVDERTALEHIIDALRLDNMLLQDGPAKFATEVTNTQTSTLKHLIDIMPRIKSTELLNEIRETITTIAAEEFPSETYLEWEWRMCDKWIEVNYGMSNEVSFFSERGLNMFLSSFNMSRSRKFVIENRERYFEVARRSYCDFHGNFEDELATWAYSGSGYLFEPMDYAELCVGFRAYRETWFNAIDIVIALELYRINNGNYPETLNDLEPDYIEDVPVDSYCDTPFAYIPIDGDYRLYSLDSNQIDEGTSNRHMTEDIVIRLPKSVKLKGNNPRRRGPYGQRPGRRKGISGT